VGAGDVVTQRINCDDAIEYESPAVTVISQVPWTSFVGVPLNVLVAALNESQLGIEAL
jgi:hypothetical protein